MVFVYIQKIRLGTLAWYILFSPLHCRSFLPSFSIVIKHPYLLMPSAEHQLTRSQTSSASSLVTWMMLQNVLYVSLQRDSVRKSIRTNFVFQNCLIVKYCMLINFSSLKTFMSVFMSACEVIGYQRLVVKKQKSLMKIQVYAICGSIDIHLFLQLSLKCRANTKVP